MGSGRTPVALAGERPVHVVLEPLAHSPGPGLGRMPVDGRVVLEEAVLHRGRADVPGVAGHVEERAVAAPAVRIAVLVHLPEVELVVLHGPLPDGALRSAVLDVHAGEPARHAGEKTTILPHGMLHREPRGLPEPEVVLAVHDRRMDDPGPVVHGHEVRLEHGPRGLASGPVDRSREEGLVAEAGQFRAAHLAEDLVRMPEDLGDPVTGQDEDLARPGAAGPLVRPTGGRAVFGVGEDSHPGVGDVGADREPEVPRQRPGRRGPTEDARALGVVDEVELHGDGGLGDVLIPLCHLVAREARATAWTGRDDAVSAVQQPPSLDLGQRPPSGLDEVRRVRDVRVAVVEPVADIARQSFPFVLVAEHVAPAGLVELPDPVALDLGLAGDPERALDLEFDGEPVRVPPGLPRDVSAGHGSVPQDRVLDRAREDVMDAGVGVRRGGTLVEHEVLRAGARRERPLERLLLVPASEYFGFESAYGLRYWPVGHQGTPSDLQVVPGTAGVAAPLAALRSTRRPSRRRRPA